MRKKDLSNTPYQTELVHGKFLRNVLFRALLAALTSVISVEWSLLFADAFQIPVELASTVAFFSVQLRPISCCSGSVSR